MAEGAAPVGRASVALACTLHVGLARVVRTLLLLATGCTVGGEANPAHAPSAPTPSVVSHEAIQVQRGMRSIGVYCALDCRNAQVELDRLQQDCVRDPQSNVHHISTRPAMIHLGCCTEAASVFVEACGEEAELEACVGRWSRERERGSNEPAVVESGGGLGR